MTGTILARTNTASAKLRIFENQQADDWAVVNFRDALPSLAAKRITFSAYEIGADLHLHNEVIHYKDRAAARPTRRPTYGARHNTENLMAALGVGLARGLTAAQMTPSLRSYRPQPHRCELVRELDGVTLRQRQQGHQPRRSGERRLASETSTGHPYRRREG